jgi:hypothetical protein
MNNDNKTTQLLNLMPIICKINNPDVNNSFFELISNIYCFQMTYRNFYWPFYSFLEPLLVNIDTKSYSQISDEVSFLKFQSNLIKYLNEKEIIILKESPNMLKNGFYFGDKNNNGIIAEIDKMPDDIIISFGFKLIIKKNEPTKRENILVQFKTKNENSPALLKINILNKLNKYYLSLITKREKEYDGTEIIPYKYYIFSLHFKQAKCYFRFICDDIPIQIFFDINKKIDFTPVDNLILCVGCDIEFDDKNKKNEKSNYIYKSQFTGFIGDIHIINSQGFEFIKNDTFRDISEIKRKKKDKKEQQNNETFLQEIILDLKGKYGNAIVKSINEQINLDEYIMTNLEAITKEKSKKNDHEYFNILILKDNIKGYKIIDNVALFISTYNFKLIDYMDNIDYLNYDNLYFEKEKDLKDYKKEYQYINNYRIYNKDFENKAIEINTKLFDCNFNIFENRSSFLRFIDEDGIYHLILILEYYYQILYKIDKNINNISNENNKKIEDILNIIEINVFDILTFFKKILFFGLNLKTSEISHFYYQINEVIKQYIKIRSINEEIINILLEFLKYYQKKNILINRNFFLDLLLNPKLYNQRESYNLLNNDSFLFESLNKIVSIAEKDDDEELKDKIHLKIMNLSTIVLTKEFNHKINDILDEQLLIVKDRYLKLLFNYSISLNKKKKKEIIFNLYMFFKTQFKLLKKT